LNKYDVLIIGSGLGGLLCGYILSKEGYNVCIVEKNDQIGGCMQTFNRDGCTFDTGIHYLGSLDKGQVLYSYFKYFGLIDKIKMKRLDPNAFDKIVFESDGKEYNYAMGNENFINTLLRDFPNQKDVLIKYMENVKNICDSFDLFNLHSSQTRHYEKPFIAENTFSYLQSLTENIRLQNVLAGLNLLYAGIADSAPLYVHSLINYSYIQSAYRLVDGSSQIVDLLTQSIIENGGTILKEYEAKQIYFENEEAKYVEFSNKEIIEAKSIISNIHPTNTIKMIPPGKLKKPYVARINSLENTISTFTLYITLKKDSLKYINSNYYMYRNQNVWVAGSYLKEDWPDSLFYFTPANSKSEEYADSMIVIAYMRFDEVQQWGNTTVGKRGSDYEDFKKQKAEIILNILKKRIPNLSECIKNTYSSTPLTYRDYTGTVDGSIYGIIRDSNEPYKTFISHKTKIPNLFFTGQNIIMHGALGVTISSIMTCAEFVGLNYLLKKVNDSQ